MINRSLADDSTTRRSDRLEDRSGFDRASWLWLGLALLILLLDLAVVAYRHTLPSDGWDVGLFVFGGERRLLFNRNLLSEPSPLEPGDALVAVAGQPIKQMMARAITLNPQLPAGWTAGQKVPYTVLRDGGVQTVAVPLQLRPATFLLRSFADDPVRGVGTLGFLALAFFVFARRPRDAAARVLLMFSVCLAAYELSIHVSGERGGPAELFDRVAYWPTELFNTFIWPLALNPLLPHLFLIFPVVKAPMRRYPGLTLAALYGLPALAIAIAGLIWHEEPLVFWSAFYAIIAVQLVSGLLIVVASVWHSRMTIREPVARAQVRWMTLGFAGMGVAGIVFVLTRLAFGESAILSALITFGGLLLPLSISIAILRYRLFAIDLIINRTLVYGTLSAVLALIYVVSVVLLQQLVQVATGETQSDLVIVGSTLAIAALFQPLRRRVQSFIDRRFYRHNYDAERTLAAFSARVRDTVDLTTLTTEVIAVIEETMQPAHVSLWLREAEPRD